MLDFNLVIFAGRLTRDPRIKYTHNHKCQAEITIASCYVRRDWRGTDAIRKDSYYVDCWLWGRTAERAAKYCGKGTGVLVEGRLRHLVWHTDEGERRTKHIIEAQRLVLLERFEQRASMVPQKEPPPPFPPHVEHMRRADDDPLVVIWPFDR